MLVSLLEPSGGTPFFQSFIKHSRQTHEKIPNLCYNPQKGMVIVNNALRWLDWLVDCREQHKVRHLMKDIVVIVFFATVANADDWVWIHYFAKAKEKFLRKYLELPNGIPSHDTIQRVFAMVNPDSLIDFQKRWNEMLNSSQGDKLKKILAIDGKTQRGNKSANQKANHIVSCVDENGFCLSQKLADDKSNEITAIPSLLDDLY